MSINILPSEIFNRIAAGEVIENPSSVVKELVENSIDAGATEISIEVKNGGKYVRVTDNGGGISANELPVAFMPHATGKIHDINDLDNIKTLGFRGEALPSIASVAKVTAVSRQRDADLASKLIIENGKVISHGETGAPFGTSITVDDIFKNVPARLKFLKSDKTEEGNISALVGKFIIANYNISIDLEINGNKLLRSSGKGMQDAIFAVYGNNFIKEMSYIESIMPDIAMYGYVNKPNYPKHNRTYQTLVINGRYVANADISFWVYNCFSSVLMKRQYPAYIIYINMPYDMVDINVHPNKMDVKFIDFDRIRRMLSHTIGDALKEEAALPKELNVSREFAASSDDKSEPIIRENADERKFMAKDDTRLKPGNQINDFFATDFDRMAEFSRGHNDLNVLREPNALTERLIAPQDIPATETRSEKTSFYESILSHKIVGKLFNTYIVAENGDEIILIDQHAAHERILFDKFSEAIDNGTNSVQNMLVPYVFELSINEASLFDNALITIESLGFTISKLSGSAYSLSEIPMVFSSLDMAEFITQLVKMLSTGKMNKSEFIRDMVAQTACKSAVKGKTDLSEEDMTMLIKQISSSKIQLFCPHGRPIAIKLTKSDIEKWFKRIV